MRATASSTAARHEHGPTGPIRGHTPLLHRKCACGGSAGLTGKCADCAARESEAGLGVVPLQAKLIVGAADDPYEREADRIADEVMRMPDPVALRAPLPITPLLQRRAAPTNTTSGPGTNAGARADPAAGMAAPPIVYEVLASPGRPLDTATRAFFEPRFGHDLSHVRVHADAKAAESAQAVGAAAYTVTDHVVLGGGHETKGDLQRLLAHELVHALRLDAQESYHPTSGNAPSIPDSRPSQPKLRRQIEPNPLWGTFAIRGNSEFVRAVRNDLNALNRTGYGGRLLRQMSQIGKEIQIEAGSSCDFLPTMSAEPRIFFRQGGCRVSTHCQNSDNSWLNAPSHVYLYHEIVHANDYIAGRGYDAEKECRATGLGEYALGVPHNENRLRCELSLPVRPCYAGSEVPCGPPPTCREITHQRHLQYSPHTMAPRWSSQHGE